MMSFISNDCFRKIYEVLQENNWLFTDVTHTTDGGKNFYRNCPKWTKETLIGRNLLGNPSGVVAFKTDDGMDEKSKIT